MAVSPEARAFAEELFAPLGGVSSRRMFGVRALYSHGQVFALLIGDDRLYLKAKGALADALAAEGAEQFGYSRKDGRVVRTGHWSLPEAALDDPELACGWARRALAALAPG